MFTDNIKNVNNVVINKQTKKTQLVYPYSTQKTNGTKIFASRMDNKIRSEMNKIGSGHVLL